MKNNMLANIQKNFPAATEKNIQRIMEAKNPLSTKQGRTCVNNGYYALNAYAAGEWTLDKVVPYVMLARYITSAEFPYENMEALEKDINRKLISYSSTSGTLKTCTYSAWKHFLNNTLPEEVYKEASKKCTFEEIDFSATEKRKAISSKSVMAFTEEEIKAMYTADAEAKAMKRAALIKAMEEEEKRAAAFREKLNAMLAATEAEAIEA